MKPTLACDFNKDKSSFPYMAFPKIDGVRALNINGELVARSGKPFQNELNSDIFSHYKLTGFDGEMVVRRITGDGICSETTSALTTIKGEVDTNWCLFDYVEDGVNNDVAYIMRYRELVRRVRALREDYPEIADMVWVIPYNMVHDQYELDTYEAKCVDLGYEGVILRDPLGKYKYGRSTANEGSYLRLKQFQDAEIVVTSVCEGATNNNELGVTPNGYAERSTHAENMVPNGMVGTIRGYLLEDQFYGDKLILEKGLYIEIAPGKMTHAERVMFFENQDMILDKIVKFQYFPVGIKDKPRFPTFQHIRDPIDL